MSDSNTCTDKELLDRYRATGLAPEEILTDMKTVLQSEIQTGIQPYISEIATLHLRAKRKDATIKSLNDRIADLESEVQRLRTEHQDSGLTRDVPKTPKYYVKKLSDGQSITFWYCPVCNSSVSNWEEYCNDCGQRLANRSYDPEFELTTAPV